jgi:hypothetical protein
MNGRIFSQTKAAKHYAPSTQRKGLTCQWWCKDNVVDAGLA